MSPTTAFWREAIDVGCVIEIEHNDENLYAHVTLDDEPPIEPGDRVHVYGKPIDVRFGDHIVVRRRAVVERATGIGRLWTRLAGHLHLAELYEVSFTSGRVAS